MAKNKNKNGFLNYFWQITYHAVASFMINVIE